jgi:hypothetical protein
MCETWGKIRMRIGNIWCQSGPGSGSGLGLDRHRQRKFGSGSASHNNTGYRTWRYGCVHMTELKNLVRMELFMCRLWIGSILLRFQIQQIVAVQYFTVCNCVCTVCVVKIPIFLFWFTWVYMVFNLTGLLIRVTSMCTVLIQIYDYWIWVQPFTLLCGSGSVTQKKVLTFLFLEVSCGELRGYAQDVLILYFENSLRLYLYLRRISAGS